MRIQVSHGAGSGRGSDDVDWFVVLPLPGQAKLSVAGTPITNEMEVESLLRAGRTVYEVEVEPWGGKPPAKLEDREAS